MWRIPRSGDADEAHFRTGERNPKSRVPDVVESSRSAAVPVPTPCPAGIDVKKYVGQIAGEDFEGRARDDTTSYAVSVGMRTHMPASVRDRMQASGSRRAYSDMHLKRFAHEYESRQD